MSTPDRIAVAVEGSVATVTLDRPASRNAVDLPMCLALRDAFERLDADREVAVVLLRGAGPSFCAGADLKERKGKDGGWVRQRRVASFAAYRAIESCRKPVIGLLHGTVVGSGGELAMSCDFAYATTSTSFRFPEVHWGTIGATQRLPRVIGIRRAKELLLTNATLSAQQAYDYGLVQSVVAEPDLLTTGRAAAERIAAAPHLSVTLTKRAMDVGTELTLEQGIDIELRAIEQNLTDGDWRVGIDRFLDDHRPDPKRAGGEGAPR